MNNIAIVIIFWFGVLIFVALIIIFAALMDKLFASFEQRLFFINVNDDNYYVLLKILKEHQVSIEDISHYIYYKVTFKTTIKKYNQIIYHLMDEKIIFH